MDSEDQKSIKDSMKREIAWESQSLIERLRLLSQSELSHPTSNADSTDIANEKIPDQAQTEEFKRYLEREGLNKSDITHCVTQTEWPSDCELPEWINDLADFLRYVSVQNSSTNAYIDRYETDPPFIDILFPWVEYGYSQLSNQISLDVFSPEAIHSLKDWLLSRIISIADRAIYTEFQIYLQLNGHQSDDSRSLYQQYVDKMTSKNRLEELFLDYPLLGRFFIQTVKQWIGTITEFCQRLKADKYVLRETFDIKDTTQVEDLTAGIGDRHQNGRSVIEIQFSDGTHVLYKPRSISSEILFDDLVGKVVDSYTGFEEKYVSRDEYGWIKKITATPCKSEKEIAAYYEHAGKLISISYLTCLNDCHDENIIAHGNYPIIVDAETIFQPQHVGVNSCTVEKEISESVLGTGFLPISGHIDVTGGLFMPKYRYLDSFGRDHWEKCNSADMEPKKDKELQRGENKCKNVPYLQDEYVEATRYVEELVSGFIEGITSIQTRDDPISVFTNSLEYDKVLTRYINRTTAAYKDALSNVTSAKGLQSGLTITEVCIDEFAPWKDPNVRNWSHHINLFECERTALIQLDVPRFTLKPNGTRIFHEQRPVSNHTGQPGIEHARTRLKSITPAKIQKQVEYIRLACRPQQSPLINLNEISSQTQVSNSVGQMDGNIKPIIHSISRRIQRHISETKNPILFRDSADGRLELSRMDQGLYWGTSGIALFYAFVASMDDSNYALETSYSLFNNIIDSITTNKNIGPNPDMDPIGFYDGLGGYVYALGTAGNQLEDYNLIDAALTLVDRIQEPSEHANPGYDVTYGAAGWLLALLKLYEITNIENIIDSAIRWGDYLLDAREHIDGYEVWNTELGDKPLTGFSHGISGIAYALSRLGSHTTDNRHIDAAIEGFLYEDSEYMERESNWPDFREHVSNEMDAWCHGRAGIILARLGASDLGIDLEAANLQVPVNSITDSIGGNPDQLCCGNAGRADILIEAAKITEDTRFRDRAGHVLNNIIERQDSNGCFNIPTHATHIYNPTLFQGSGGVGYALLRYHDSKTPCVLLGQ